MTGRKTSAAYELYGFIPLVHNGKHSAICTSCNRVLRNTAAVRLQQHRNSCVAARARGHSVQFQHLEIKIDWNQAAVLKLIEQWSKNDCLYNTTNGLYHNKHARSAAMHRICVHVKKILPNVKANDVKIKINYLRSQYGRELLKVRESRRSGIRDDLYIPTAYWFEHLHFLKDFMNVRKDTSNLSLYKVELSLKHKLSICSEIQKISKDEICKKYGCSRSTVNRILRNEKKLVETSKTRSMRCKRNRSSNYPEIDEAVTLWFDQMLQAGSVITGAMIIEKANQLAIQLKQNFTANTGWLWRWQKRRGITLTNVNKNVAPKSDVVGQSDHTNCSVKAEKSNCREFEDSNVNENAYNEEAVDVRNTKRKRPRINTTQILARSPESNSTTFSEKNSFVSHVSDTQAQQQLEPFESYQAPTSNNNSTLDINDDIEINDEDLINIENDLGVIQNLMPRSKASMQLEEELTKAETEYYRCKADYFTKLAENSKIKRTLMLLESRKLQLEIEQLTHN